MFDSFGFWIGHFSRCFGGTVCRGGMYKCYLNIPQWDFPWWKLLYPLMWANTANNNRNSHHPSSNNGKSREIASQCDSDVGSIKAMPKSFHMLYCCIWRCSTLEEGMWHWWSVLLEDSGAHKIANIKLRTCYIEFYPPSHPGKCVLCVNMSRFWGINVQVMTFQLPAKFTLRQERYDIPMRKKLRINDTIQLRIHCFFGPNEGCCVIFLKRIGRSDISWHAIINGKDMRFRFK